MMKQVSTGVLLIVLVGLVAGSEDKYSVKVQGGLAFSEFRGYEDWQAVGVSRSESALAVILGNPALIASRRHSSQRQGCTGRSHDG